MVELKTTRIYEENASAWLGGKRRALNEGGTSSSKTWSVLQLLALIAKHAKTNFPISVVSESMPHLKRGCIRDFFNILGESQDNNPNYNKTDKVYSWGKGFIEFFPADEPAKLRGGRRKILFINECNNISWESFQELDIRTELFTFLDWNPVGEFWAHEKGLLSSPENAYIHSTYLAARHVLPAKVVENIESKRLVDPNWWNVYGLGKLGKVEGLVYPYFEQMDDLPAGGLEFYGLDFGYSNDPTVLVKNIIQGDIQGNTITGAKLYSKELIYETGLTNNQIAARMEELGVRKHFDEIFADSAEPKSIEEIYQHGYNIKPCPKGADSVEYGHQRVRQFKQYWTKDSLNCIKEQRNYRYITDKAGKLTEKTMHIWSHGMDARRYGVVGKSCNATGSVEKVGSGHTAFAGVRKREF